MKSLVATSKPRIQSNIEPRLKDNISEYIAERLKTGSFSESRAIEDACIAFFGIGPERLKKLIRLAEKDRRTPGDYIQLLIREALDKAE